MTHAMDFTIRRGGHVVLRVTDPFSARDFLEAVLGFQTTAQEGNTFFFLSTNPVSNHHMLAVRGGKPGERLPEPGRQIGMIGIAYEASNLDVLRLIYRRISDQGGAYGVTILRTEDRGTIYNLVCSDTDGNRLEFFCAAPEAAAAGKAPFALRGPLDEAFLHATGEGPQTAAPKAGIRRTGHLALRCNDLAASKAFYEQVLHLSVVAEANGRLYLSGDPATGLVVLALEQAHEKNLPVPTPRAMYALEHYSLEVGSFEQLKGRLARGCMPTTKNALPPS